MIIPVSNISMQAIPRKDYKGPVLKLTKKDKEQIAGIEKNITGYHCELTKLEAIVNKLPHCFKREFYETKISELWALIEAGEAFIRQIKITRHNKQVARAAKKLNVNV